MRVIYLAGPYSGDIDGNIQRARALAIEVWRAGLFCLCPHLNTIHFEKDLDMDSQEYVKRDLWILARCDALLTIPGWEHSEGARQEVSFCLANQVPVFHSIDALVEQHKELRKAITPA